MLVCSLKGIEIRVEALALDSPSSRIETAFRPCSASEKLRNIGARLVSLDPRDSYTMRMRKLEAIFFSPIVSGVTLEGKTLNFLQFKNCQTQ